jgi:chloride channel protein, CIC family
MRFSDKKLRFTALLPHICNPETLRAAYFSLTLGCIASYLLTALLMPRSILTGVDPLETVIVSDLMSPVSPLADSGERTGARELFVYADCTCRSAAELMATEGIASLPVADRATQRIHGTITLQDLLKGRSKAVVRENERLRLVRHLDNARREHN